MATLNSQQYINIQYTTYKQIQNTIEQMESCAPCPQFQWLFKNYPTANNINIGWYDQEVNTNDIHIPFDICFYLYTTVISQYEKKNDKV
jgi:hypothetical protein